MQTNPQEWPAALRLLVNTSRVSEFPICILWSEELIQLYNDKYGLLISAQSSGVFGKPAIENAFRIWSDEAGAFGRALKGESLLIRSRDDYHFPDPLSGRLRHAKLLAGLSPIMSETNSILGIYLQVALPAPFVEPKPGNDPHAEISENENPGLIKTEWHTDFEQAELKMIKEIRDYEAQNRALRESEERYHNMIREIEDYAIILLDVDGNIQNWNAGAERIKGYTYEEIVGQNFRLFYPQADQSKQLPERLLNQAKREGKATHEGWRIRKDRSAFWGSIVITALHNEFGEIIGYSKVTRDLTELKLSQDKQQEYLRQLTTRNQELEQFVYIASHDLQEPLRKIQTFTQLMDVHMENKELVRKYLSKTTASAKRMSALIKSVLNYSQIAQSREDFVLTNLTDLVIELILDFELVIKEKKAIVDISPLPEIHGFPGQLQQLFSNLISNALKFSAGSPKIIFASKLVGMEELIHPPMPIKPSLYHQISIQDNGIGFDEKYKELIFSMFQRLHSQQEFEGTGIGLALCRKIMERHNGYIAVQSEISKGTTFYLYFPGA